MRRKDREIANIHKIEEILKNAKYMPLEMFDGEYPYVVPLHYGYQMENENVNVEISEMIVELGTEKDIDHWINLVDKVKGNFPGLESEEALEEHRKTVLEFMNKESAICAKTDNKIVGILLFSRENNTLCFLAVDTAYRRQHIAEKMVSYMMKYMDSEKDIVVTTYRAGVPEGIAARLFYKKMGFVEGKLTEEFGSPVQEFILRR